MAAQKRIPAVFMRGGSSKGAFFRWDDVPPPGPERDRLFLEVIGSPDPYKRQLNGLGGGVSSLSKAVVVGPSTHPDADVDYTFGQVVIDEPVVDYSAPCGNLSSAVGPFAVDYRVFAPAAAGSEGLVRIHDTNTGKLIHAHVPLGNDGDVRIAGDFEIPGVAGAGARIQLDWLDPGGAATGRLLPTGNVRDVIEVPGVGEIEVSIVDAACCCIVVRAEDVGLTARENVDGLETDHELMARLETIRRVAAVRAGMAETPEGAAKAAPKMAVIGRPGDYTTLAGTGLAAADMDIAVRAVSMGQIHRVLPLTASMCLAVACRVEGTLANDIAGGVAAGDDLRLGNPSGVLPLGARVAGNGGGPRAETVTVYRTARALMEGHVLVPA